MIAYLSGTIRIKQDRGLVLDVNGVGYSVYATRGLIDKTHEGEPLELHIHTHVREDDISLYGFVTKDEWKMFRMLLSVSGIGPRSALEIQNAPIVKVKNAIANKDVAFLTQIPGIGKKTAERIIVDLQGKIEATEIDEETKGTSASEDIVQALISLGYQRHQVLNGLKKIPRELESEELIIKYFLQNI